MNMRIIEHGAFFLVIAVSAAVLPEVDARKYICNRYQDNKSRRCDNYEEKTEHLNYYSTQASKKDSFIGVRSQSFFEFLFGGFVRPFTGRIYDDIQRIYPENRKTPKVH